MESLCSSFMSLHCTCNFVACTKINSKCHDLHLISLIHNINKNNPCTTLEGTTKRFYLYPSRSLYTIVPYRYTTPFYSVWLPLFSSLMPVKQARKCAQIHMISLRIIIWRKQNKACKTKIFCHYHHQQRLFPDHILSGLDFAASQFGRQFHALHTCWSLLVIYATNCI